MGGEDGEESGECAVCRKGTSLKCGNCRVQFYCDKKHQKEDWSRHKASCQAWEVRQSDRLGRYLVAARDLKADDVIITEMPIISGPLSFLMGDEEKLFEQQQACVGCWKAFKDVSEQRRCPLCLWPACSPACEGLTDRNRHGLECPYLQRIRIVPRLDVLLPLRMLIHWRTKSKRWATLSKMQSHAESRIEGTEAHEKDAFITRYFAPFVAVEPAAAAVIPEICGIIDINAFNVTLRVDKDFEAIYETACLMEHSCIANTRHTFKFDDKGRPRITVMACRSIQKYTLYTLLPLSALIFRGEHITTMYTHVLWATQMRRNHLIHNKFFECTCERCADPTELGTHFGTLKCLCNGGLVLPKNPLDRETEWSCNSCSATFSNPEIAQLTDQLKDQVDMAWKTPTRENFCNLLTRLEVLLHSGHEHCISVAHALVQLLPPEEPQKLEICKRLVETNTILDPYGARIPVYTATALRELARCPGQDKKEILTKAASLLRYEPPNLIGGQLLRLVESDLSSL